MRIRQLVTFAFLLASFAVSATADEPLKSLADFLEQEPASRAELTEQVFAKQPLTKQQSAEAMELLWADMVARLKTERAEEVKSKSITLGDHTLKYDYRTFGKKGDNGRSLFISMHGGGGAPARVNDQQWRNQIRLYEPEEGVYVAPRAPSDTWNLWHRGHIDPLFDRLITNMIVFEDVDPNKVYLMGYSAGGDGVYQLAPRMSDRFAAAAMMAGHPNETSPLGLRNIPFTLFMGGKDGAYKRNKIAGEWKEKLAELNKADPKGYTHLVTIYPEKGHWMDREDASSLAWMAKFDRRQYPRKVVWKQDDVTHNRFYWLRVPVAEERKEMRAEITAQKIDVESDVNEFVIRLNDEMLDLDQEIEITSDEKSLAKLKPERNIMTIAKTLDERRDPGMWFSAEVRVKLAE